MQEKVKEFNEQISHREAMPPEARLLDINSELGELAKEYLKATNYGTKDFEKTDDLRAKRMAQLVKYGTEDEKEIMMLRYGFSFEDIEWLEPYIREINQEEIVFSREIKKLPIEKMDIIKRFIWQVSYERELICLIVLSID